MKASIILSDTSLVSETKTFNYDKEETAQEVFDVFTDGGSEWAGLYQWDLVVHHPVYGDLTRRTMYTNQSIKSL